MARHRARRSTRLLAALLLAAYAPIGVLGYGLHRLWRCEHIHGCEVCGSDHEPGGDLAAHACESSAWGLADSTPGTRHVTNSSHAVGCQDCAICSFLAQAQSASAPPTLLEGAEPLASAPTHSERLVVLLRSEAALARGPPSLS